MAVTKWRPACAWRPLASRLALAAALAMTAAAVMTAPTAAAPTRASAAGAGQAPRQPAAPHPATQVAGPVAPAGALGTRPACGLPAPGFAECLALVDGSVHWYGTAWATGPAPAARPRTSPPAASPAHTPAPYMAADLQAAYKLPSKLLGARQTIAVVDVYDDPNAAADLAVYRKANHLPACGAAFGCFEKVNQDGQRGDYPRANRGWAAEESIDVDMASAICPNCKVILVEADRNTFGSLQAAEDEAARLGANVISDSWGAPEYSGEVAAGRHYAHPGVAIVAASGDSGFGMQVPAAYASVIAVGGTALYRDATRRGWSETPWSGIGVSATGSGCSAYVAKPPWQHDPLCGKRTVADVAAVADPATPVAVYDTFRYPGWLAAGGTSVAAPIIAGAYALAGNTRSVSPGGWLYAHHRSLFDVTSGFEGSAGANGDCGGSYLCTVGPGYDGPTGWGTPRGIGAF